ncbi:uncharacterized protein LOC111629158 isoform X2 [Centruroides sculpturatus]|uniref:uncharacterized protein LOC111629134 n=1 Tax=Centruroides sculpturatus TaxID=218467 RepID=UPI000C6D4CB3|nr:uncharacterized protein LOC111629134 [Centruroides sculpturatus]XP_023228797.1 uncharacterized protein LOC111629158 isoform X2 [Centruroides sculpturatus]
MKIALAIVAFGIATSFSECRSTYPVTVEDLDRQYCELHHPERFRYCMLENDAEISVKLHRNCALQVKYYQTLGEIANFICKTRTDEEYAKYLRCFVPALEVEFHANLKFIDIVQKCLKSAASE